MKETPGFEWPGLADQVLALEREGLVTRTFRRLDPERQTAVIQAILDEAAERGPTGLNIKEVAARAGVSVGSLYQYFGNRERMLDFAVALCRRYMEDVFAASRPHLLNLPLRDALAAYVVGGLDWAAHQAALMRLFARAAYHGGSPLTERLVRPVSQSMRALVREMLEAAVARGELRADADVDAVAGVIHALTIVLGDARMLPYLDAYLQLQTPEVDFDRALSAALDLVMLGLAPRSPDAADRPALSKRRSSRS
jgi:AcrR family transcriptional regulator